MKYEKMIEIAERRMKTAVDDLREDALTIGQRWAAEGIAQSDCMYKLFADYLYVRVGCFPDESFSDEHLARANSIFVELHGIATGVVKNERLATVMEALGGKARERGILRWDIYEDDCPSLDNWFEEIVDYEKNSLHGGVARMFVEYLWEGIEYTKEGDSIKDEEDERLLELMVIAENAAREKGQAWYDEKVRASREEFQEWLDSFEPNGCPKECPERFVGLEQCDDILPADYCVQLEIPRGSSYAQAVASLGCPV